MRALRGFSVSARVSGPGDFGAEDVGFLSEDCFHWANGGGAARWGGSRDRNLCCLGVILLAQQKLWGFTDVTQDCLWVRTELHLPTAAC